MEIEKIKLTDLKPSEYNPRLISETEQLKLKNSMETFGIVDPIIINLKNMHIIGGHQRYEVLLDKYMEDNDFLPELDLIRLGNIGWVFQNKELDIKDENHEKALNLALNKISGDWDYGKLNEVLDDLAEVNFDIDLTGFDELDMLELENLDKELESQAAALLNKYGDPEEESKDSLQKDFIAPPFSVLNTNLGYWQDLKKEWKTKVIDNAESREKLIGDKFGTSIFDPVLADIICKWFLPNTDNPKVFDTFAGGTSFGYIATTYNATFTGIELRQEQADINNKAINKLNTKSKYICDDGRNILKYIEEGSQDLFFSCPPYYNLEVYSDLENDASNQNTYQEFYNILNEAFINGIKALKDDRFAIIVCGDVRDKNGFYYNFPNDIINTFEENGMHLYNEIILYEKLNTARLRARLIFKTRKVVKTHQKVLCFYKGDPKQIKHNYYIENSDEEEP